jgi:glycine hydroxymethyltransferase
MAGLLRCARAGDTILSLELSHGGHLTHGLKVNFSGRPLHDRPLRRLTGDDLVDYDDVLALAKEHRPKLIVCGGSAYPRTVETWRFREIADEVGALLLCDMAHFAGLVAAGIQPNPVEHCDFVTSTTHKTLAGPRSGFVPLPRGARAGARPRCLPGDAGRPLNHVIAAKAACFKIAASEAFRELPAQVRANADALAEALQDGGLDVLTGGTDTHVLLVDLRPDRVEREGRRRAPRRGRDHREPQHGSVRRAASDGRFRLPCRDAGDDDAGPRRGRLPRGRRDHVRRAPGGRRPRRARLAELGALERRPLYPGLPAFPTFSD